MKVFLENDDIDLEKLRVGFIPKKEYSKAHQSLPIVVHDVFVQYGSGILLVKRKNEPAKDILWPLGGRLTRGVAIEDSLKDRVRKEANLEISGIKMLGGPVRLFFQGDHTGHGRGTDNISFTYFAIGKGSLKLDDDHEQPTIISKKDYKHKYRDLVHPYVKYFMDQLMESIQ